MPEFTDAEIRRYGRQMVLPEVGGLGQERLRSASVSAVGELEALYLAGAGVGALSVPTEEIARAVRALNPHVRVEVNRALSEDPEAGASRALATLKELLSA